ncbi:PQQ-binding-like beta-propeller repeat protein [Proteobacteria bacterium 005FR1]|nr:PQQ-binding-like beta-propeller repeat protein [Proteobacteria bacterium 005FR1]
MKYAIAGLLSAISVSMMSSAQAADREANAIFETYCFSCHGTGWQDAPVIGDTSAWQERRAKGMDALLSNTIKGINGMPAKGACSDCTEAELQSVIELLTAEKKQVTATTSTPAATASPSSVQRSSPPTSKSRAAQRSGEWRNYANDGGSSKYTPLAQIDEQNVSKLQEAWRWNSPDNALQGSVTQQRASYYKSTPLMVDGRLFVSTGFNLVVAIDPASGETIWQYDPKAYEQGRPANSGWQHRGLSYWESGADKRVIITTGTGELIALNAQTGEPIKSFGKNGKVDLQAGITQTEAERRLIGYNSPPAIVKDTVVVGCTVTDGVQTTRMPTCHLRGFDVRTGKQRWIFHTVPQRGEPGVETWGNGSWQYTGNTNAWSMMSVDEELGYVYVPTGTPTNDFYGGHRPGYNLYGESLLAIDASTGKLVWHFQAVHHGLWDYDFPAAPNLVDIVVDGKPIKAVAQVSKQGFTYVFDRRTGEPVWPIEERPVPQSTVPGEQSAATQPFPTKPPAFARQGITEDDLIDFTPALRKTALEIAKQYQLGPLFTPPSLPDDSGRLGTLQVPSAAGGANWGGAGFDPELGYLFVQAANQPSFTPLEPGGDGDDAPRYLGGGRTPDISALQGLPLTKPPYGTVTAIDLNRGEIAWQVAHGQGPTDHPAIKHLNLPPLGASSHSFLSSGGPLVTKTLVFFNQVQREIETPAFSKTEYYLRAFDKRTGDVVWEHKMDVPPFGTPMSYLHDGRQYIVVSTGGGGMPAQLVAYALDPYRSNKDREEEKAQ